MMDPMDQMEPQHDSVEDKPIHDMAVFSRAGFSILALLGIQQIAVSIIAVLVSMYIPQIQETGWYIWVLSYVPLYLLAFPVTLLILRTIPNREGNVPEPIRLSGGKMATLIIACLGIVYPLNLLATAISAALEAVFGAGFSNPLASLVFNSSPWVNLFFAVLVAPVMEEILFRHLLYKKLIVYGGKVYVLLSAFLFALMHPNLYQLVYAFVIGVIFASVTYFTGTIRYTIALHICLNFIGSGMAPFLLAYGTEMMVGIWGMLILIFMVVGIIICVRWWKNRRKEFHFLPGKITLPGNGILFLNPGVIIYAFMVLCLIAVSTVLS